MNCPHCHTKLITKDRGGIDVEHCPRCGGIWLDHGDMDRILDRSQATESMTNRGLRFARPERDLWYQEDHDEHRDYAVFTPGRRPTWFEELFQHE